MAYFDGQRLHYHKLERSLQVKRAAITSIEQCQDLIRDLWNITFDDVDDIGMMAEDFIYPVDLRVVEKYSIQRVDHHRAHYLSAAMLTDHEPQVGIIIDGEADEGCSWSVYRDDQLIKRGFSEHNGSVGTFLEQFGYRVGVSDATPVLDVAGKLMGLQSYGKIDHALLESLGKFDIRSMNRMEDFVFGLNLSQGNHLDVARTVHHRVEQIIFDFFVENAKPHDVIVYSGGVAQNVLFNSRLRQHFPNIVIPPHSTDDGLSLGIMEYLRIKNGMPRFDLGTYPYIMHDRAPSSVPSDNTVTKAANLLAQGRTLAWYQGHGELGARALGNRSILMDPRLPNGRQIINNIKRREYYRPFGAVILEEHADRFFEPAWSNPYMLYVSHVKSQEFPAITHVDGTCRVQTLGQENPVLRKLLEEFYRITGCPMLLNTSLNVAGRPIAGSPKDADELFQDSDLDVLVMGDHIKERTLAYA